MKKAGSEKKSSPLLAGLTYLVIAAGAAAIVVAGIRQSLASQCSWLTMIFLALCVIPLSSLSIPGVKAKVTLGDVVMFACAALFGPNAAIVTAMTDGACSSLRMIKVPRKFFYNVATNTVAMALATFLTGKAFPVFNTNSAEMPAIEMAAAIAMLTVVYFFASTFLIAGYLAASTSDSLFRLWKENFLWTSVSYAAGGISAFAVRMMVGEFGYWVFAIPVALMIVIFSFYRNYFNKVESASVRADQIEELNFRALETLIAAIGAVGHTAKYNVRRIERLALELGKQVGCSKEELKALRIAAALYDIGNIAVPQHILDKPCALTPREFDLVKTHAATGAEIVKSMGFQYPVIEIIRHHHERFDGTGYPAALAAHEIPLGARVLAIVDCYNALTTDRSYRLRMSHRLALEVMRTESGSAFDPALLAKFIEVASNACEEISKAHPTTFPVEELWADLLDRKQAYKLVGNSREYEPAIA